ncbi:hypothetical protein [Mannheimia indoligenes]|uniref:hypothetical protein n=1 Tax=Mannheimia indoligenes TaxID=3103145 RepID=UPI002FE5394C
MYSLLKECIFIYRFQKLIHIEIDVHGIDVIARKVYFDLWGEEVTENNKYKLTMLKYILNNIGLYYDYRYRHDIICYLVKALELRKIIPSKNLLSHCGAREYAPAKNGQNILKHGVSFNEFIDGGSHDFGLNSIGGLPENRILTFATLDNDCDLKNKAFGFCISESHNSKLRIISARKFTINNYKSVINSAVKGNKEENRNLERKMWELMREIAKEHAIGMIVKI